MSVRWSGSLAVTPATGAAAMSSGIVSVGLQTAGAQLLSRFMLAVAVGQWLVLAVIFGSRFSVDRSR